MVSSPISWPLAGKQAWRAAVAAYAAQLEARGEVQLAALQVMHHSVLDIVSCRII